MLFCFLLLAALSCCGVGAQDDDAPATRRSLLDELTNSTTVYIDLSPRDTATTSQLAGTYSGTRIKLGANLNDPGGLQEQIGKARAQR